MHLRVWHYNIVLVEAKGCLSSGTALPRLSLLLRDREELAKVRAKVEVGTEVRTTGRTF